MNNNKISAISGQAIAGQTITGQTNSDQMTVDEGEKIMEFKDRVPEFPGRVKLKNVDTGEITTYDMELAEGSIDAALDYAEGTPLNAATLNQFQAGLKQYIANNPGPQGPRGERGDPGTSLPNTFLVGTDNETQLGWYKIGEINNLPDDNDYYGTLQITSTYDGVAWDTPSGVMDIHIRMNKGYFNTHYCKWRIFTGVHPDYVCMVPKIANGIGKAEFYIRVPYQWCFYRIDVLSESNRSSYESNKLFARACGSNNNIHTVRAYASKPSGAIDATCERLVNSLVNCFVTVNKSSDPDKGIYEPGMHYNTTVNSAYVDGTTIKQNNSVSFNILNYHYWDGITHDYWYRFPIPAPYKESERPNGMVYSITVNSLKRTAYGWPPHFICCLDDNYVYVCSDENDADYGISVSITWVNTR